MSISGPSGPLVIISSKPKHVVGTQKKDLNETVF